MIDRLRRLRASYRTLRGSYIWTLLGRQRRWVYFLLAVGIANFLIIIGILDSLRRAFDYGILEQTAQLGPYVASITGLAFLGLFTGFGQRQIIARIGFQLEYELRLNLYRRLQSIDPRLLDNLPTGQLITRAMTDLTLVELLVQLIPTLGVGITLLIALAALMVFMHPLMAVVALAGMPVNAYLIGRVRRPLWGFSWLALNRRAQVTTAIDEAVRGIRVVKSFGREDSERGRVREAAGRAYAVSINRVRMMAKYDLILQAIPLMLNGALLIMAGRAVANGEFSVGELLIFLVFTRVFTGFAQSFDEIASGWMFAKSGALRIFELLNWGGDEAGDEKAMGRTLPSPSTGLVLHAAEIGFGTHAAVGPVDLQVGPGRLVVLTGAPGSGKSLVAAMAGGGVSPTAGSVTLDGADLTELDADDLRRAVRVVSEDPFLFARSVRHNLEVGAESSRRRPSDDELWSALRAAAADEIVEELPEGLDSVLGDRGMTLSGGQRQRLALARALVAPPRVLVLDDALSAVNPALELDILGRLREHAPEMGILVITRRQGAQTIADDVVTLPDPVTAKETVSWQDALEAVVSGRTENPPDPELAAAVAELPPDRDTPEVDEAAVAQSDEAPNVRRVLGPFGRRVALAVLVLLGYTAVSLVPEGLFKIAVDDFREGVHDDSDLVAVILVGIAALLGVLAYFLKIFTAKVGEGVLYLLRRRTFHRLSRLGIDYYDRELPGQVAARVVHDLDRITAFVETGVYQMAINLTMIVATFSILVVWNPTVGRAVLGFVPFLLIATAIQVPLANRAYIRARAWLGEVVERFQEDVAGRYVISGFGIRQRAEADLEQKAKRLRRARRTSTVISNAYIEIMQYVGWLAMAAVVDRAGNLALQNRISAGSVVALQLYLSRAMQPIPQLSDLLQRYLAARASFAALGRPYAAPILPKEKPSVEEAPRLTGDVVLDRVTFRYPGTERPVLRDVSLEIPPGTSVALVGPTGAGKSSIAKMIARIYDPDEGAVVVDGHDVRDLELASYRRRLGIVPQDAFCFRGTVADNIAYGRPEASREEIEQTVAECGAEEVLARIPGGLDGFVDEEGRNLTAAQRQLIALARAVLVEPDVLILDEATSSLDAELEEQMLRTVSGLGRTTIFITHRLPVARHADRVAVVDGGQIVEEGAHKTLLRRGEVYAALWSAGEDLESSKRVTTKSNGGRRRRAKPLKAR